MVVAPGRDERGLVAQPLRHVEAQDVAVEGEGAVDVGDLQVNMTDVDAGIEAHEADDTRGRRWSGSAGTLPPLAQVLRAPRSGPVERCEREDSDREQQGLDPGHPEHLLPPEEPGHKNASVPKRRSLLLSRRLP